MTNDTMLPGMISGVMITVTISGKTTTEITSDKIFAAKRDPNLVLAIPSKERGKERGSAQSAASFSRYRSGVKLISSLDSLIVIDLEQSARYGTGKLASIP
jgi:hypothetical protein